MESIGTAAGVTAASRRLRRNDVAVVAYHNVVSPEDVGRGDTSLHISLPRFRDQIDRLSRTHEIVDINVAAGPGSDTRPRAVITFDDAYRGAVDLALPELARRGLPGLVFASPALLGARGTWWDLMAEAGLLNLNARETALTSFKGRGQAVREWAFPGSTPPDLPDSYGIATSEELERRLGGGISVGSHALAHEHLPSLTGCELSRSLGESFRWLRQFGDTARPWLALPYGMGSRAVGEAAIRMGYQGVLRIEGGLWRHGADRSAVPRINVPAGMSVEGLELRTSGLLRG